MGINNIVRTLSPAKMLLRAYLWAGLTVTDGWSVRCNGFSEIVVSSLTVDSQTGILGDLLQRANLTQRCSADPDGIEWEKGLLNVAINGLCGILGFTRNGQLLESKHLQALVRGVIRETQGIASFYGVKLDHEDCTLERIMISGNNTNSLVMDLRRGLLTEVEYLNGFVVRSAKESGVGSPYNTFIYHLVKHLETYGSSQAVPDEY
jgi:2-dehydropantoate 2-reductase